MLFDWFNSAPSVNVGKNIVPQFVYVKSELLRNIQTITDYYRTKVFDVPNQHLLVRIIGLMNANLDRDLLSYFDRVSDLADDVAGALKMTSPHSFGQVFSPGVFYGRQSYEIVISDDREFNPVAVYKDWRNQAPVRVLRHPFTDMSLGRADGRYAGSDASGVTVISVNIPLLMLQYKAWYHQERVSNISMISKRTHEFVSMYPLTNMVYSHVDVCLFNRMSAHLYYGPRSDELDPYKKCHPFYLTDVTRQLDIVLESELANAKSKPMSFERWLEYFPAICVSDLQQVIALPRTPMMRQVTWALIVARLPLVRFLVRLNVLAGGQNNRIYLMKIQMYLRAIKSGGLFDMIAFEPLLHDIETMLENDIEPYL